MQRRILLSMTAIIATALILTYVSVIVLYYGQLKRSMEEMLADEAALIATTVDGLPESEQVRLLQRYSYKASIPRLTFIARDGRVLYDSRYMADTLDNHASRPEIRSAVESGQGMGIRRSMTASDDLMYFAQALPSGQVIRVSRPVQNIYSGLLVGLPALAIVGVALFALAFVVARRQSKELVKPLAQVDLDHPLRRVVYPEFRPLLERLDEQNRTKEIAAQSRREFSANVSHELKTPLTSISGYAELIREGVARSTDVPNFADRIYQESSRLLSLISDIIELSHLDEAEASQQLMVREDVDLLDVAQAVVMRLSPTAQAWGVHLEFSGERSVVRGQRQLLDEMLANMVDNAMKYNHIGGSVQVWVGLMMDRAALRVSDDGIGIAPEEHERIFERFYRVDKSHSKESGGTGLGLSIVKHIASIHGAEIKLESALGKGTMITVTFPALHTR
ncbi:MAG: ATP-binding protein [Actinomycetaceae bacterium]|nr:ATP-binding protein [Actinomycetaceae bacterium]MDY5855020.1 ATP-binding protein [Arcanobacterium sp.]